MVEARCDDEEILEGHGPKAGTGFLADQSVEMGRQDETGGTARRAARAGLERAWRGRGSAQEECEARGLKVYCQERELARCWSANSDGAACSVQSQRGGVTRCAGLESPPEEREPSDQCCSWRR